VSVQVEVLVGPAGVGVLQRDRMPVGGEGGGETVRQGGERQLHLGAGADSQELGGLAVTEQV
jgi:hypothetical protein